MKICVCCDKEKHEREFVKNYTFNFRCRICHSAIRAEEIKEEKRITSLKIAARKAGEKESVVNRVVTSTSSVDTRRSIEDILAKRALEKEFEY